MTVECAVLKGLRATISVTQRKEKSKVTKRRKITFFLLHNNSSCAIVMLKPHRQGGDRVFVKAQYVIHYKGKRQSVFIAKYGNAMLISFKYRVLLYVAK
jgi:hypothetical protein